MALVGGALLAWLAPGFVERHAPSQGGQGHRRRLPPSLHQLIRSMRHSHYEDRGGDRHRGLDSCGPRPSEVPCS